MEEDITNTATLRLFSTESTHTHTNYFDFSTPVAGGDGSGATAETMATCAGIAPFNSLQG